MHACLLPRRYIIGQNVIPPMCELLSTARTDTKCLEVVLNGLEIILRTGSEANGGSSVDTNPYSLAVEQCFGMSVATRGVAIIYRSG